MESLSRDKATLHQRIESIEKQNRRLKSYVAFLAISFLFIAVMGAKAGSNDGHFRQIFAERITIVDDEDQEIILIGSGEEGTGIRILNKSGTRLMGIGIAADEGGSDTETEPFSHPPGNGKKLHGVAHLLPAGHIHPLQRIDTGAGYRSQIHIYPKGE